MITTEPLGYLDFLCLEADAAFVVTDSGGVQEETTVLGVRCFTLRDSTERRVTEARDEHCSAPSRSGWPRSPSCSNGRSRAVVPGWDGAAGGRAAAVLRASLA